jgi:CDP-glycerol glycerophosphotransferase (TagB/SpsB family)
MLERFDFQRMIESVTNIQKIYIFITKIIYVISVVFPRSKKIWVYGAWQGRLYADNSKYLFRYANTCNDKIKHIWISNNIEAVNAVKKEGFKAYHSKSLKAKWYVLRAGVVFETEGHYDTIPYLIGGAKIVQLWHGMGAKAMRWKNKNGEIGTDSDKERFNSYYWMSTSELYSKTIGELLQVDPSRFIITGYPRNDTVITKPRNEYIENLKSKNPDAKFIIYMPTHRNFGKDDYLVHNMSELTQVDRILRENNIFMVYKPHIHELKNILSYEGDFTNIILAKDENIWSDVYSYLHYFDALISDYSSVLTDFMCTGKPIVLFAFDIEKYKTDDAGLNDFFWRIPGGPICTTWDEVMHETIGLLENDTWKEEREKARIEYHLYNDGNNCERVYRAVMNIISNKLDGR